MTFRDLALSESVLRAIEEIGYEKPSPIQEKAIPPALAGRDVLGCAQTGTGKTAAFALPVLEELARRSTFSGKIRALVLTPTRELALQIEESFHSYGKYLPYRVGLVMGGVAQGNQIAALHRGVDVLVATPGRLLDLQSQRHVDLSGVEFFVLDEADRMLDMGFIHDVKKVIALLPQKKQTMFFTATMPPEIDKLAKSLLVNPASVAVTPVSSTVELTEQSVYFTDKASKTELLIELFKTGKVETPCLVFTRTKYGADKLARKLKAAGVTAMAIHGDKSQGARQNALDSFKKGKIMALVATDIAARGIDVAALPSVVNYELPNVPETYVHRIGRTGRAGRSGVAVSLCDIDEKDYLRDIEKLIGKHVTEAADNPFPMTVFEKSPPKTPGRKPSAQPAEHKDNKNKQAENAANKPVEKKAEPKKTQLQKPPVKTAAPPQKPQFPGKKQERRKQNNGNPSLGAKDSAKGNAPVKSGGKPSAHSGSAKAAPIAASNAANNNAANNNGANNGANKRRNRFRRRKKPVKGE